PFLGGRPSYSQPIKLRLDEMVSGVKADVAVKVFGDDLQVLKQKAQEGAKVLGAITGSADGDVEEGTGQPGLRGPVKQGELARYGVPARAVLDLVESLGGLRLGEVVQGPYRFPLVVRLPESYRGGQEQRDEAQRAIANLPVVTAKGERIPLARLASVEVIE